MLIWFRASSNLAFGATQEAPDILQMPQPN